MQRYELKHTLVELDSDELTDYLCGNKVVELFKKAKEEGDPSAVLELQRISLIPENLEQAHVALGQCFYYGYGTGRNYERAFYHNRIAANENNHLAKELLADQFAQGQGVAINLPRAAYHYYELLTKKYHHSDRVFKKLKILADANNSSALFNLVTDCYMQERGTLFNLDKAIEYAKKSMLLNDFLGMYNLGSLHKNKKAGNNPIFSQSATNYWFQKAKQYLFQEEPISTEEPEFKNPSTLLYAAIGEILPELNREHSKIKLSHLDDSDYDSQIIIDFLSNGGCFDPGVCRLTCKWMDARHTPCPVFFAEDFCERKTTLKGIQLKLKDLYYPETPQLTRIYLAGHGNRGSHFLSSHGNKKQYSVTEIATHLANFIVGQSVVIVLDVCWAAVGHQLDHSDSFAAQLSKKLRELTGRNIPVVAKSTRTSVSLSRLRKLTSGRLNKQPGTKHIFRGDEERYTVDYVERKAQIEERKATYKKWSDQACVLLTAAKTSHPLKQQFIGKWIQELSKPGCDAINMFKIIQAESKNPNSVLRKPSNAFRQFAPQLYKWPGLALIERVVEEGKLVFNNQQSFPRNRV